MSPSLLLPFVEKYPEVPAEERALLLEFVRFTPLSYGAWKPFKKLFKRVDAAFSTTPDIELMAALLERIDNALFTTTSTRWTAVDATLPADKTKTVSGDGFKYSVGGRNSYYDYTGFRLVVEPQETGVLSALRRRLGLAESDAKTVAFDFDSGTYIYGIKKIGLSGGLLTISCGSDWNKDQTSVFIVDVSDPNFIHLRNDGPKAATIQYIKRRARRILRALSQKNPELYVQLTTQFLVAMTSRVLDPAINWAAMDVLFFNSARWNQTQPGRGAYKKMPAFVRLRREERAPAIWDAHLPQVEALLSNQNVPLEANEMALKVLRANKTQHRVLDIAQLGRFLASDSPVLQSFSTRALGEAIADGQQIDGATWAQLVLKSNARNRRLLIEKTGDATFYIDATKVLSDALDGVSITKKRRAAATLVARFADEISDDIVWKHLETFADVNAQSRIWVLGRVAQSASRGEFGRLSQLSSLRDDLRESALASFTDAAKKAAPSIEQSLPLVAMLDQANNALGWRFLAATNMTSEVARALWRRVWESSSSFAPQVHATAAQNDGALQLFERVGFSLEEIEFWLSKLPAFQAALSAKFFASIFGRVSAAKQIELALSANDEQWSGARAILLETLENEAQRGAFWNRVLDLVSGEEYAETLRRIVDDEAISATFARVPQNKIAELLERTDPALEPWLIRWLDANLASLGRDDKALMFAAMSPLVEIRRRGLARVQELGLSLPLSLRLMECGLPQPFEVGKKWFETNQELDLADRALALCDSPDDAVRAFGRTFLETHRDRVLDASLLKKLSENSDPQMQAWLAEHLLRDALNIEVAVFDAAVLRARGRARRAKEAVKLRRDTTKTVPLANIEYSNEEVATLLDVARGRTSRDREWALQQLAQVALSGKQIDGVTIS